MRKSQLPLRKTPFKSFSEEKPKHEYYIGSEYKPENDEEKEQHERKKHNNNMLRIVLKE